MNQKSQQQHHDKRFQDLFWDTLELTRLAVDAGEADYRKEMFSRASILYSCLCIECAANACIDQLAISNRLKEDVDTFPFLSKFEFYFNTTFPGQSFERGVVELQAVAELKKLRDGYVHPKVIKKPIVKIAGCGTAWEYEETKHLKIPLVSGHWESPHAVLALQVMTRFLNYFFCKLCKYDHNTTCDILLSQVEPRTIKTFYGLGTPEIIDAQKRWDLPLAFLGLKSKRGKV